MPKVPTPLPGVVDGEDLWTLEVLPEPPPVGGFRWRVPILIATAVLLFLAAIISAFWYLRNEEIGREFDSVRRDAEMTQQQIGSFTMNMQVFTQVLGIPDKADCQRHITRQQRGNTGHNFHVASPLLIASKNFDGL